MERSIIYLHGFASGPTSTKAQFFRERLDAEGVGLEIPDLAEGNFEGLTITGQLRVMERLRADRPSALIGSSLGGYVAALYAARHPEVDRLVLLAPAFGFAPGWAAMLGEKQMRAWKETGSIAVYHYGEKRERHLGYQFIADALQYEGFPALQQPALIFHGTRDTIVPPELSIRYAEANPNARLRLVDSDHDLLTALETIWEEARPFLVEGEPR